MYVGHDTTSYTIAWIMIEVAKQPLIHARIKAEIETIVGKNINIEHISQQHLSSMVFLNDVIKEGMRLWPVAAMGSVRKSSKDIKYQDMIIPKGSTVSLPQYVLFRMGIQNSDTFNPDRWQPDSPDLEQLKGVLFISYR
jgi:cytochrome P450